MVFRLAAKSVLMPVACRLVWRSIDILNLTLQVRLHLRNLLVAALVAMLLPLVSVGNAQAGDSISASGDTRVPGVAGHQIHYEVTIKKDPNNPQGIKLKMTVKDLSNAGAYSFWLCAMVQTIFDEISVPQWELKVENGRWTCTRSCCNVSRRPSYHFGCQHVSITSGGEVTVFDDTKASGTSGSLGQNFDLSDIASMYWDLLADMPGGIPQECLNVAGKVNINIGPSVGEIAKDVVTPVITNSVNTWAGGYELCHPFSRGMVFKLTRGAGGHASVPHRLRNSCYKASWQTGNWVTMTSSGEYPGHLVGDVTGGPASGTVIFALPGQIDAEYTLDDTGKAHIDETFSMTLNSDIKPIAQNEPGVMPLPAALASSGDFMTIVVTGDSSLAPNGSMKFVAEVDAMQGASYYKPGQFMYSVSMSWVQPSVTSGGGGSCGS